MEDLIGFLGINDRARRDASLMWPLIERHADAIIATFYAEARHVETGVELDAATIRRLQQRQRDHWRSLFASVFDGAYSSGATLVGIKHREIGLDLKWYVAGYQKIKAQFARLIWDAPLPEPTRASLIMTLDKYVALDMALAVSAYSSWLVD